MKLSVLIITYNQERYIAQAIESALAQEVGFDWEIVIGEDCSTDATRQIVADYHRRHPGRIRPLLAEANQGMVPNLVETLRACQGEYVALLEGDDYWTCPDKLRTQVDFLDSNPDFAECCHRVEQVNADGQPLALFPPWEQDRALTIEGLLEGNPLPTCSTVFRRTVAGDLPEWFRDLGLGDWPLHMLNARRGRIKYLAQVMGAYRVHLGGVWTSHTETRRLEETVKFLDLMDAHLGFEYHRPIGRQVSRFCYHLALAYEKLGEAAKARAYAWRSLKARPIQGKIYRHLVSSTLRRSAGAVSAMIGRSR